MNKTRVFDIPTRLFHWIFAAGFVAAFAIGNGADDESALFPYHMLVGLLLAFIVILRIIWGFVGSRYARFSSFALKPRDLAAYFRDLFSSKPESRIGHNPASSWAAIAMMLLTLGLALTGILMAKGAPNGELLEGVHEVLANLFLVVVLAHLLGLVLHTVRHKDSIALSMIHGKKKPIEGAAGIERMHAGVGVLFLLLVGAFAFHLNSNYDPGNRTLNALGGPLKMAEAEESEDGGGEDEDEDDEDGGEDDDD